MVYIKEFKKNIFPAYINPERNELFSSWYCRLAISHYVKPLTFIKNNFGHNAPIFGRDIDYLKPDYLVKFLLNHTPLSKKRIDKLFLTSYNDIYFNNYSNRKGHILSLGLNNRNRKRFGTMCCPKCLSSTPYYKKEWRLFSTIICMKCKSSLIDRCPNCQKPISYHLIYNSGNQSIPDLSFRFSLCWYCKMDLSTFELTQPTSLEIEYQNFINRTLNNGFNHYTNYSFSFINGLILLCRTARGTRKNKFNKNFTTILANEYNLHLSPIKEETGFWSLQERKETLPFIYKFIKDFTVDKGIPQHLNLTRSYLTIYKQDLDYWLISLLDL